jgi:hypothetical protein
MTVPQGPQARLVPETPEADARLRPGAYVGSVADVVALATHPVGRAHPATRGALATCGAALHRAAVAPPLLCAASPVCDGPDCDGVDPRLLRRRGVVGLPPGVRAELPRWDALARDRDVVAAREEVAPEAQEVAAAFGGVGHGASVATGAEAGQ